MGNAEYTLEKQENTLSNLDINRIISQMPFRHYYRGTLTADYTYNINLNVNESVIYNPYYLFRKNKVNIGHWIAIYRKSPKTLYIYDSSGTNPYDNIIDHFRTQSGLEHIFYWNKLTQEPGSADCGYLSIYFLVRCYEGMKYQEILDTLSEDKLIQNGIMSKEVVQQNMKK